MVEPEPTSALCDFCLPAAPGAVVEYPCRDFVELGLIAPNADTLGWGSRGEWAACPLHRHLVDQGLPALLAWARRHQRRRIPDPRVRAEVLAGLEHLWGNFYRARTGPARPVTGTPEQWAQEAADSAELTSESIAWIHRHQPRRYRPK